MLWEHLYGCISLATAAAKNHFSELAAIKNEQANSRWSSNTRRRGGEVLDNWRKSHQGCNPLVHDVSTVTFVRTLKRFSGEDCQEEFSLGMLKHSRQPLKFSRLSLAPKKSSPLSYLSSDDVEEPLTPSHLLVGHRILNLPDNLTYHEEDGMRILRSLMKHWRGELSSVLNHFWKRSKEWTSELMEDQYGWQLSLCQRSTGGRM